MMAVVLRLNMIRRQLVNRFGMLEKCLSRCTTTTSTDGNASSPVSVADLLHSTFTAPDSSPASIERRCSHFCLSYRTLPADHKCELLKVMAQEYGVKRHTVTELVDQLVAAKMKGDVMMLRLEDKLRHALKPRYYGLFSQIGRIHEGVKFLVDLRADVLTQFTRGKGDEDNLYLTTLNSTLRDLLALWFSVGFLNIERVTWHSSCHLMEKISDYEAVLPIRNWTDLKRRVGPYRRCFVCTHSSMPNEPIVILYTALTTDITSNIHSIVSHPVYSKGEADVQQAGSMDDEQTHKITTAIFYSITSTQTGLRGIDMGNFLIRNVVQQLQLEFPKMQQFSSLSPIPGFRDWLIRKLNHNQHSQETGEQMEDDMFNSEEVARLQNVLGCDTKLFALSIKGHLQSNDWSRNDDMIQEMKAPLMRLCAQYLYKEKRRGYALSPVANFHLRNGAVMWRLNWLADQSPRGMTQSCGMMVNYRYYIQDTEENSETYLQHKTIPASSQILQLVGEQGT